MNPETKRGSFGPWIAEKIIGILAAYGAYINFIRTISQWKGTLADYAATVVACLLITIAGWTLLRGPVSIFWAKRSVSKRLANATRDSGLSLEHQQSMVEAMKRGKDTEVLPISTEILCQLVEQGTSGSFRLGAPAHFKETRSPLIRPIAKLLMVLMQRADITEEVIEGKMEFLRGESLGIDEVQSVVEEIPLLDWGKIENEKKSAYREDFIKQLARAGLLRKDAIRIGNISYAIQFNVTSFCFSDVNIKLKLDMLLEARTRYEDKGINTVVCIEREPVHGKMNAMVQQLASNLGAEYHTFKRASKSDELSRQEIHDTLTRGPQTLLVEPFLFGDGLLDDAYEFLVECGAKIVGIYVMFSEKHFDVKRLRHAGEIQELSKAEELRGQILLDLKPIKGYGNIIC